jgi:transketolase
MHLNNLEYRILEISYKYKLSHLSSNLTAVNIIDEIYSIKEDNDIFILSSGHAGLALYVVLEKYYGFNAEKLHEKHGVHPNRDIDNKIFYSSGSLGCGLPAAVGMALANKNKNIYCLISDGESFEGSIYESLNIAYQKDLTNLKIYLNLNGYSALSQINTDRLHSIIKTLWPSINIKETQAVQNKFKILNGVQGHYKVITQNDWEKLNNA